MSDLTITIDQAVGWTLAIRDQPHAAGTRAVLARGLATAAHRDAALAELLKAGKLRDISNPALRYGAVLATAVIAANPRIPHKAGISVGRALAKVDRLGPALTSLTSLPGSLAAQRISQALSRTVDANGRGVDFYALGTMLVFWDHGSQEKRRAYRQQIILDYYTHNS